MMEDMNDLLVEMRANLKTLGKEYPDVLKSFSGFVSAVEREGALSVKTKELISVALSMVTHCKWCIAAHVKNALEAGASKDEIMEASFVAVLMGGGPALMYVQLVMDALDQMTVRE